MKDIVELLRNAETSVVLDDGKIDLVIHVAADEIERLRDLVAEAFVEGFLAWRHSHVRAALKEEK